MLSPLRVDSDQEERTGGSGPRVTWAASALCASSGTGAYTCKRSYSEELPDIAPHHWYTRRVQRKFLDMYTTIGGSLRRCAGWMTAEITGRGRTFIWDPLARAPWWGRAPEPEPEIELSHTTGWRWVQAAGDSWRKREDAYADVPQSGAVASDATYVRIRGSGQPFSALLTGSSERPSVCSI